MNITSRVHWLSITVFGLDETAYKAFWEEFFSNILGELVEVPGGSRRGFRRLFQGLAGAKVYVDPVQISPKGNYFHIDLPGSACECLTPEQFRSLAEYKSSFDINNAPGDPGELRISRFDLAVDDCPFTPYMVYEHYRNDLIKTFAKRSSITWIVTPDGVKENGEKGTSSIYIGSSSSERMLRIYDKHGFTRAELQLRGNWADSIFLAVCKSSYSEWLSRLLGIIDRFFSVISNWWMEFVQLKQQVGIIITSARVKTLDKMARWVTKQVAPTIVVLKSIMGDQFEEMVYGSCTVKKLEKFGPVLQLGGI